MGILKPLKIFLTLLFFLSSGAPGKDELPVLPPEARAPIDSLFDTPLSFGIDLVYQDRYQEALTVFDSLQLEFPNHPAPYFYKAAVYQSWMSSFRFNHFHKELEENIKIAIDKGNDLIKVRKNDPWLNFYLGAAYGYRAFFRYRKMNWIGAYMDGKKGVGNLKKALKKNPELYDAYLGLGTYHYWRTARSKVLKVVAFWMKDKREFGIQQIDFSLRHGRYCLIESGFGLVATLYDYKKYDEALTALDSLSANLKTPVISAIYLRARLMGYYGKWAEMRQIFEEILARLEEHPYESVGFKAECKYWIAKTLQEEMKLAEALVMAEEALALAPQRDKDKELEGPLESFKEIHKRTVALHSDLQKK